MTVKISYLNKKGDQTIQMSPEEAEKLIYAEKGRYFIVDRNTKQLLREIKVEDGQELLLIPHVAGG